MHSHIHAVAESSAVDENVQPVGGSCVSTWLNNYKSKKICKALNLT